MKNKINASHLDLLAPPQVKRSNQRWATSIVSGVFGLGPVAFERKNERGGVFRKRDFNNDAFFRPGVQSKLRGKLYSNRRDRRADNTDQRISLD